MQQNNTLPEEILEQIDQEAISYSNVHPTDTVYDTGMYWGKQAGYTEGATVWATRYQEVVEENTRLRKALERIAKVNNGRYSNPDDLVKLVHSIANEALNQQTNKT